MPLSFDFNDQQTQQLVHEIGVNGFAQLRDVVSEAELQQLREFVDARAQLHQGEYFAYHGEKFLAASLLSSIWSDPNFKQLVANLYRHAARKEPSSAQIFPVLRCVQGNQGQRESNCFHFDASLVTALVPIFIPSEGEERGDLMLFPNLRNVRTNVLFNVIEKAVVQNSLCRKLISLAIRRGWLKPATVILKPGDIYLFWGYRSLHANKPCSPGIKRATAIFHFGDPHSGSLATRMILQINQRRARRASSKTGAPPPESTPG
jgi:hypothetical protein